MTDIDTLIAGKLKPKMGSSESGFERHRICDAVSSRSIHSAVCDALRPCCVMQDL